MFSGLQYSDQRKLLKIDDVINIVSPLRVLQSSPKVLKSVCSASAVEAQRQEVSFIGAEKRVRNGKELLVFYFCLCGFSPPVTHNLQLPLKVDLAHLKCVFWVYYPRKSQI